MNVLQEILDWSQDRPVWQRDALRRLITSGDLSDSDIVDLTNICKGTKGLLDQQVSTPLAKEHVPDRTTNATPVSLVSIFHHRGVNALAENQTLKLSAKLTVVYGDNGAGKTGYIRILKEACRARGKEPILGNVTSGQIPLSPVVSIRYNVGSDSVAKEWAGTGEDKLISRVSVFDTQSAAVYLTEKTDVAFRPFGLDLFDKLVKACKAVKTKLDIEQRALGSSQLSTIQPLIPEGTQVSKLFANITSLTNPASVQTLANLTIEEESRIEVLEKSILDLQANDPRKLIQQLTLRAGRLKSLAEHMRLIEKALSTDEVEAVFKVRTDGRAKAEQAKQLHSLAFPNLILKGTGSDSWKHLWESARLFSQEQAYPGKLFPVVDTEAHCVLCQQVLDENASNRFKKFEEFIASTVEQELKKLRDEFVKRRKSITELVIFTSDVTSIIAEIKIENEETANKISQSLETNEARRRKLSTALSENTNLESEVLSLVIINDIVESLKLQIESRIKTLQESLRDDARKRVSLELNELKARKLLNAHLQTVLNDIERQKKYAAYSMCIEDTATQTITRKSSQVTKEVVSQHLKDSFKEELRKLQFNHAEVELREDGGSDGVLYHKLILTRAPGVNLPKVTSEGEQRCLSIAAFFAELSTADDPSGIVFDDPISSLDFKWRESVARRLVLEAKKRQVVVFTHDVVFLLHLKQYAEEMQVEQLDQHVQRLPKGAGVCVEELPWFAMPVKKKIGYLKNQWQEADKLFRDGHISPYEKEATHLYGLLRSAWERALEEVLLGGLIERFRVNIQTQQIENISDINLEECRALDAAMTKCSKWIAGHDQAAAARAPIPEPAELKADIDALDSWVQVIRKRRN
jgi:energy-coupling factor transporter ATP-binding protein EcfA2